MNKNDFKLLIIVIIISLTMFLIFNINKNNNPKIGEVYYENKLVLTLDLEKKEKKEYTINGYNGNVIIEVNNGKIRVKEEKSPKHLCSKQGYITSSNETIVCLPNKVVIKIKEKTGLDTIAK